MAVLRWNRDENGLGVCDLGGAEMRTLEVFCPIILPQQPRLGCSPLWDLPDRYHRNLNQTSLAHSTYLLSLMMLLHCINFTISLVSGAEES